MSQYMHPLVVMVVLLGVALLILLIIYAHAFARAYRNRLKNKQKLPHEGKCACGRTIKLGSLVPLKNVDFRCRDCGQPFQFPFPL